MNDIDKVRKSLKTILKSGDLYHAVATKQNVNKRGFSFIKSNILVLSRILFAGILIGEKIVRKLFPIEKIKDAQDQIRASVGVDVDVVCHDVDVMDVFSKLFSVKNNSLRKSLGLFYENNFISVEEYIANLKKISSFCEMYEIDEILLNEDDIFRFSPNMDLGKFVAKTRREILGGGVSLDAMEGNKTLDVLDDYFLCLDYNGLLSLTKELESVSINTKLIEELGEKIEDLAVKDSIEEFLKNGNLEKLKTMIGERLTLYLNSEGVYKDKEHGKVYDSMSLFGEYLKVQSTDEKGTIINSYTISILDYLGVKSFQALYDSLDKTMDDKELYAMSLLYLYLCTEEKVESSKTQNQVSFFDRVYKKYTADARQKIYGMFNKGDKFHRDLLNFGSACILTIFIVAFALVGGLGVDVVGRMFFLTDQDEDIAKRIGKTIIMPYTYSYELEKDIVENVITLASDAVDDFIEGVDSKFPLINQTSLTGDSVAVGDEIVGIVSSRGDIPGVNDDFKLPTYFATGYATSADYANGKMNYNLSYPTIAYDHFRFVEERFQVSYSMDRKLLKNYISEDSIDIPLILYPLGANYGLTRVYIVDKKDNNKSLTIDAHRALESGNSISEEEKKLLESMRQPEIVCCYGLSIAIRNGFVVDMHKDEDYVASPQDEVYSAIVRGLGLSEDATLNDIVATIRQKYYSETPFKDAKLTRKVRRQNETEYFETVAGLDSLICNLAATLTVASDDDLIYVCGFLNDSDQHYIKADEFHAWAMDKDGNIIDSTPYTREEKEESKIDKAIQSITIWAMENGVNKLALLALVGLIIERSFGKKIRLAFKINNTRNLLESSSIGASYATLNDILYGGINIPREYKPEELVDIISKQFAGMSKEDLKKLKEELKSSGEDSVSIKEVLRLVEQIPFIVKKHEDLHRSFVNKPKNRK